MLQMEKEEKEEPIEEYDFTKPDYEFIPEGVHEWRQKGYYLVCMSCELQHAVYIGPNRIMVGVDKSGDPILKTRKELGMA